MKKIALRLSLLIVAVLVLGGCHCGLAAYEFGYHWSSHDNYHGAHWGAGYGGHHHGGGHCR